MGDKNFLLFFPYSTGIGPALCTPYVESFTMTNGNNVLHFIILISLDMSEKLVTGWLHLLSKNTYHNKPSSTISFKKK